MQLSIICCARWIEPFPGIDYDLFSRHTEKKYVKAQR